MIHMCQDADIADVGWAPLQAGNPLYARRLHGHNLEYTTSLMNKLMGKV